MPPIGEMDHPNFTCRNLMVNGQWCVPESDRPADWRQRQEPKPILEAKAAKDLIPYRVNNVARMHGKAGPVTRKASPRQPKTATPTVRAAVTEIATAIPKPKYSRANGRGKGWNRKTNVTWTGIVELQKQGKNTKQIAEHFAVREQVIVDRITEGRRSNPESQALYTALRSCPKCGKYKRAYSPVCAKCKRDV